MAVNKRPLLMRYGTPQTAINNNVFVPLGGVMSATAETPDGTLDVENAPVIVTMKGNAIVPSSAQPVVAFVQPTGGPPGTTIRIHGDNVISSTSTGYVQLTDSAGAVFTASTSANYSNLTVTFDIPSGMADGPATARLVTSGGAAVPFSLYVGDVPEIMDFAPISGIPGRSRITLTGRALDTPGLKIFIGNKQIEPPLTGSSPVYYRTPEEIRFFVPAGVSGGFVTLSTSAGSATSFNRFSVSLPTITSDFSTAAYSDVHVGDTVAVQGTNFDGGALMVDVGGIFADPSSVVVAAGGASLTFVVPPGAVSGPVTVGTVGGEVSSAQPLTIQP